MLSENNHLCYVEKLSQDSYMLFFSNVDATEMTGDDWDDGYYDVNASYPYEKEGQSIERMILTDLSFTYTACDYDNMISVYEVNHKLQPWLSNRSPFLTLDDDVDNIFDIYANDSMKDVIDKLVQRNVRFSKFLQQDV